MSVRVQLKISLGATDAETVTLDFTEKRPGDNPRYNASITRSAILAAATRADEIIKAAYGDIGRRAIGGYTGALVATEQAEQAAPQRQLPGGEE